MTLSLAIPTYGREDVLIATIEQALQQSPAADEILVIDQTPQHEPRTERRLSGWNEEGRIRWIKHSPPNLPGARNRALAEARSEIILFIDDDVNLPSGFIGLHLRHHCPGGRPVIAGSIASPDGTIQSGETFPGLPSLRGGNFSVRTDFGRALGGFDENYSGAAYREESDFAARCLSASGDCVEYAPEVFLIHLAEPSGGCRSWGTMFSPLTVGHSVGDYYFALANLPPIAAALHMLRRPWQCIARRQCLQQPWLPPLLLCREFAAFTIAAYRLACGRRLISNPAR